MRHYGLIFGGLIFLLMLAGCGERPPLPVFNAPLREEVLDVPGDGIIKVKSGDTIYKVANRYQVTPRRIILSNKNLAPPKYPLDGVKTLTLPKPRGHIVKRGDTLDTISARYKVNKQEMLALNNLHDASELYEGLSITIPRKIDYSLLDLPAPKRTSTQSSTGATTSTGTTTTTTNSSNTQVSYSDSAPDFVWPVDGRIIGDFGTTARGVHNDGVNIAAAEGEAVRASQSGEVAFVGAGLKNFGNLVLIKHRDGWITAYAHLSEVRVNEGDFLDRGAVIGGVGQSGRVDSPQLHFEIRKSRTPVNPKELLS